MEAEVIKIPAQEICEGCGAIVERGCLCTCYGCGMRICGMTPQCVCKCHAGEVLDKELT